MGRRQIRKRLPELDWQAMDSLSTTDFVVLGKRLRQETVTVVIWVICGLATVVLAALAYCRIMPF